MSPFPATISSWLCIVEITGSLVSGSNSAEFAPCIFAKFLATSMTIHCSPKHNPKVGILFSRANCKAPNFPSMPRTPNPPGTQMACTSFSASVAPFTVAQSSLATHLIFTLALFANPPARSASVTDK